MHSENINKEFLKRPGWLKVKAPGGKNYAEIKQLLQSKSLHTVCEEARCPNIADCWNCGTATFIIMGDKCTRNCRFCAITKMKPLPLDKDEPQKVAESVKIMNLKHCVITSVTRDDLEDGGAHHWAETIRLVRELNPNTTIEALIPDFCGDFSALHIVFDAKPDVLNHNVETVPRLYNNVRPKANYELSLKILEEAHKFGFITKSGLMVGLGETNQEVMDVIRDLREINVDYLTIGQYLQPSKEHLPIHRYVTPAEFDEFKEFAISLGFKQVQSAPLVRSSYHAEIR